MTEYRCREHTDHVVNHRGHGCRICEYEQKTRDADERSRREHISNCKWGREVYE